MWCRWRMEFVSVINLLHASARSVQTSDVSRRSEAVVGQAGQQAPGLLAKFTRGKRSWASTMAVLEPGSRCQLQAQGPIVCIPPSQVPNREKQANECITTILLPSPPARKTGDGRSYFENWLRCSMLILSMI